MRALRTLVPLHAALLCLLTAGHARAEEIGKPKSEATAAYLSAVATLIPVGIGIAQSAKTDGEAGAGLIFAGYALGPSVGHFYAGNPGAAMGGIGLRLVPIVGLGAAMSMSWDSPSEGANAVAVGSMALGAAMVVWDIARTAKSVRSHNEKITTPRISLGAIRDGRELTPAVMVSVGL